ncbi:MAG: leucine-rich repeat protein [Acutalibacteraceae bacterium]
MKKRNIIPLILVCLLSVCFTVTAYAAETEGIFTYTVSGDEATVTKIAWEGLDEITIPETLGGYTVTKLGSSIMTDTTYEFGDNNVTSIYIPKTVKTISSGTFDFADVSRFVVDPENTVYSSDEAGVLFNKDKTLLIKAANSFDTTVYTVPDSVTEIGFSAFNSSLFVQEIYIPDSVAEIGQQAFFQALSLRKVRLPEGLTTVEQNLFALCSSLEEVSIPSTVTAIRNSAFTECTALEKVIIPEGVASVDEYAFESDTSLKYVFLPSTLTAIKSGAFGNCTSLTDICYAGTQEEFENVSFAKGAYYGDRPNAADTASVHCDIAADSYQTIDFVDDNDILTVFGIGSTPSYADSSWHYWDSNKANITAVIIDGEVDTIGAYSFEDFPALTTLIIRTDKINIEPLAFVKCPLLETVVIFSDSSFESASFTRCASSIRVFEEKNSLHSFNLSSTAVNVVKFSFDGSVLHFDGGVSLDAYEFFDTLAVFSTVYDNIEKITFTNLTFENITFFYYTGVGNERARIEGNTLINGEIYPTVFEDGEDKPVTFNYLTAGIADSTITDFTLIAKDEKHQEIIDTEIEIKEEETFFQRVLRWVVTLLNKLFTLLSKLK